jgi:saccharopine dehydrogenase-like NADP-dependent oxidoreductase
MSKVLLLGAGRSVQSLACFLAENALELNLELRIGDLVIENAQKIASIVPNSTFFRFDANSDQNIEHEIRTTDLVISMLPPHLHGGIALYCLENEKNLLTASYISPLFRQIEQEVKNKNLTFIMECGLDPGIDHASAQYLIDSIHEKGGQIKSFRSFTGGLVAPESDDNPWGYKFTWNPKNVVLAGQGISKYLENGQLKFIPYQSLFKKTIPLNFDSLGDFEAYINRDSLHYIQLYGLEKAETVMRATIRKKGFCAGWDFFVSNGMTDDTNLLPNEKNWSKRQFLENFIPLSENENLENKIRSISEDLYQKLDFLDFFSHKTLRIKNESPAQVLQKILEQKLALKPKDKDLILMQHKIRYTIDNQEFIANSSMILKGQNAQKTAMSLSVGLPVGIACKLLLQKKIKEKGVIIPNKKELYTEILSTITNYGIIFEENHQKI